MAKGEDLMTPEERARSEALLNSILTTASGRQRSTTALAGRLATEAPGSRVAKGITKEIRRRIETERRAEARRTARAGRAQARQAVAARTANILGAEFMSPRELSDAIRRGGAAPTRRSGPRSPTTARERAAVNRNRGERRAEFLRRVG